MIRNVRYLIGREPEGEVIHWNDVVSRSGWKNVVTTPYIPDMRIKPGKTLKACLHNDESIYCFGLDDISTDTQEQARDILRILANTFQEWCAGEIVDRAQRDVERGIV